MRIYYLPTVNDFKEQSTINDAPWRLTVTVLIAERRGFLIYRLGFSAGDHSYRWHHYNRPTYRG